MIKFPEPCNTFEVRRSVEGCSQVCIPKSSCEEGLFSRFHIYLNMTLSLQEYALVKSSSARVKEATWALIDPCDCNVTKLHPIPPKISEYLLYLIYI